VSLFLNKFDLLTFYESIKLIFLKGWDLSWPSRYYLPGYVWHIAFWCRKREFLLKFARDPRRWLKWLFEAKKRFDISNDNSYTAVRIFRSNGCRNGRGLGPGSRTLRIPTVS
ncbi:MAG: hypothetical protein WCO26_08525, partial [Deltaproteobacteria bacterium]